MASPTSEIRKGVVIKNNDELYVVVEFQHINPGKGAAFTRTSMKHLGSGKVVENTYKTRDNYAFMNMSSYEQIEMNGDLVGDEGKYLKEGLEVIVGLYDGMPVSIQIPKKVQYKVVEAPPAVKGNSASGNVTKEIVLDNGLHIYAPIFIKEGEEVLVNTETGDYSA